MWRIPVTDLIAAGLEPGRPGPTERPPRQEPVTGDPPTGEVEELRRQLEETSRRLDEARRRLDVAEQIAEERQHLIRDLREALRQLEPGRSRPPTRSDEREWTNTDPDEVASTGKSVAERPGETPGDRRRGAWPKAPDDAQMSWLFDPAEYDADEAPHDRRGTRRRSARRRRRSRSFWRRAFGRR